MIRSALEKFTNEVGHLWVALVWEILRSFGVTRTRQIFEKAIEYLPEEELRTFATRYATLERRLGEIDRARAIYVHTAQYCPPALVIPFWEVWRLFEVKHGNVDTVREMFRVKRSVAAQYNTVITKALMDAKNTAESTDEMKKLEQQQNQEENSGPAQTEPVFFGPENQPDADEPQEKTKSQKNLDEIELDDDELGDEGEGEKEEEELLQAITKNKKKQNKQQYKSDDEEESENDQKEEDEDENEDEDEDNIEIEQKAVPRAVFGSAVDKVEEAKKAKDKKTKK